MFCNEFYGFTVELIGGSARLVSWLQLDISFLRPPSPLL